MQDQTTHEIALKCLIRWLDIRHANGIAFPDNTAQLKADIDHSSLLKRLQAGKEPLPFPPPRAYLYPWYEVCEQNPLVVGRHFADLHDHGGYLNIAQMAWRVKERLGPESWRATYRDEGPVWKIIAHIEGWLFSRE